MNTEVDASNAPVNTGVNAAIAKVQGIYKNWNRHTTMEQMRSEWDAAFYADIIPCDVEDIDANGVACRWLRANSVSIEVPAQRRVIMYLHGGGFKMGSPISHHDYMAHLSQACDATVFAVDYRLVPEHRFPAALEDCIASYKWLLDSGVAAENISIAGDSAGGCLVASMLLSLRDSNVPLPASGVMLSALTDLTVSGESYDTRSDADPIHQRVLIQALAKSYLQKEQDPKDPLVSPFFADLAGLPPLLLQVGDRETGLSDTVDFAAKAKAAGVETELSVWPEMIHFFQQFTQELTESAEATAEIATFVKRHWS